MANTYSQIYIRIVFTPAHRQCLIPKPHKTELHKYITGIVQNKGHKMLAINAMPDHIHIFVGLKPIASVSDLVRVIKNNSSGFINDKQWIRGKFNWQEGYGAFSYGHSQIDTVVHYIQHQEEHHKKQSFQEEYLALLQKFDVAYDEKYIFDLSDNA